MHFLKALATRARSLQASHVRSCLQDELRKDGALMLVRQGQGMLSHESPFRRLFSTVPENESAKEGKPVSTTDTGAEPSKEDPQKQCSPTDTAKEEEPNLQALLKEKEALYKEKDRLVAQAKQQVLTYLAEVENLRGKTRRDAESIKSHAVQSFASDLLDMADNLHHTAASVPENYLNEKLANDTSNNAKLLKSLLEGVSMTEKQLLKIFNNFGVKKFDPVGDRYDSNLHLVINEVEDPSKEPDTVLNVVKSGYFFNDKLLRPAEVDVVKKKTE